MALYVVDFFIGNYFWIFRPICCLRFLPIFQRQQFWDFSLILLPPPTCQIFRSLSKAAILGFFPHFAASAFMSNFPRSLKGNNSWILPPFCCLRLHVGFSEVSQRQQFLDFPSFCCPRLRTSSPQTSYLNFFLMKTVSCSEHHLSAIHTIIASRDLGTARRVSGHM